MKNVLEKELQWRAAQGWQPVSVAQFESALRAIGYRRDKSMEARCMARIMTGERAGDIYPCITTTPVEVETGLRYCNASADRGVRFAALQDMRGGPFFAVSHGAILEV